MTPGKLLRRRGFVTGINQPEGATDYVDVVGVFRLRVRIPHSGTDRPGLWVGFTAGGPLVERQSLVRHRDVAHLVDDVVLLRRTLSGV